VTKFDSDKETFTILSNSDGHYAKDKDCVFLMGQTIPGADPGSFKLMKGSYGKDKERVFCGNVPMQVSKVESFEVLESSHYSWSKIYDKKTFIFEYGDSLAEVPVSKEKPANFTVGWGRDGASYYYGPAKVEGADYDSFKVIDIKNAKDKNNKYEGAFPPNVWEKRKAKYFEPD